ncbi:cathepsin L1 isoform X1 [Aedes aegypti]|uniref:Procathepsin L3, putative n=1 Tax=Aedes aegypti TaxID=7159 RepID=A0A6S4FMF9_AEDAE|nr:cathepsin L1 isoform X1 [Aedes aegypti]XP_021703342.1 cathepsin L1 isoform X1 [Aedes aegypti]XP_021703343.1 cathepsin L1 isoform X1 [Aedes aegypti]
MKKQLLWILSALIVAAGDIGERVDEGDVTNFDTFLGAYQKKYKAKYRMDRRKRAFKKNMQEIEEHNANYEQGKSTFQMGVNELADMDKSSYLKKMVRMTDAIDHRKLDVDFNDEMLQATNAFGEEFVQATQNSMPDSLDWRDKGFTTMAVNQKTCGSCYAFSIGHALNGQIMRRIGRVEYVSTQQMVDCSTSAGNKGCAGGSLRFTMQYLQNSQGIMRSSDYPYTSSVSIIFRVLLVFLSHFLQARAVSSRSISKKR